MNKTNITVIILAAGKGQRMKSQLPKVCHTIGNAPLIWHVLSTADQLLPQQIITVLDPDVPQVEHCIKEFSPTIKSKIASAYQQTQEGTGHAVMQALPLIKDKTSDLLVLYGDTPLLTPQTLRSMIDQKETTKSSIVVLGMRLDNPGKYGRIFTDSDNQVDRIVEYKDATLEERKNSLCNSGVMLISSDVYDRLLKKLNKDNQQGEYLLTDILAHAREEGLAAHYVEGSAEELQGVNTRQDLAICEQAIQNRWRFKAMENGVTLRDPQSVYFSYDTSLGEDVVIDPHVYCGPKVTIGDRTKILSFSHLEGTTIAKEVTIGPFARIRPGTTIESSARIGNFVEVKKSTIKKGSKINHLSYIGDAEIGQASNIGAGTITCNYNGYHKQKTIVGENVFIGSNTALVAPVKVGDQSIVAAGSVITKDVTPGSIALTRVDQIENPDAAHRFREKHSVKKDS